MCEYKHSSMHTAKMPEPPVRGIASSIFEQQQKSAPYGLQEVLFRQTADLHIMCAHTGS